MFIGSFESWRVRPYFLQQLSFPQNEIVLKFEYFDVLRTLVLCLEWNTPLASLEVYRNTFYTVFDTIVTGPLLRYLARTTDFEKVSASESIGKLGAGVAGAGAVVKGVSSPRIYLFFFFPNSLVQQTC